MSTPQAAAISLIPKVVNLSLYAGDGAKVRLTLTNSDTSPFPVVGGVLLAQVRRFPEDTRVVATFGVDSSDGADGVLVLSLTGEDTEAIGKTGVWDLQWTPDSEEPVTLVAGSVTCKQDVSRS